MAIYDPLHLYRNRHGGFYFRLRFPQDLRPRVGQVESRLSLGTELRQVAIMATLRIKAAVPQYLADPIQMARTSDLDPADFRKLAMLRLLEIAELKVKIVQLKEVVQEQEYMLPASVDRVAAASDAANAHMTGQIAGKEAVETALVFHWRPECAKLFSELRHA